MREQSSDHLRDHECRRDREHPLESARDFSPARAVRECTMPVASVIVTPVMRMAIVAVVVVS